MFFHIGRSLIEVGRVSLSKVLAVRSKEANLCLNLSRQLAIGSLQNNTSQEISRYQSSLPREIENSRHCNFTNNTTNPICYNSKRFMSYDSKNEIHQKIHKLITDSKKNVFVFMKGTPSEPSCRYSGIVVQILDAYGVNYDSANVLENDDIRKEIKAYSDWPTIPQVFVDGSFVGGCDILLQMHQSGEIKSLFKLEESPGKDNSGSTTSTKP